MKKKIFVITILILAGIYVFLPVLTKGRYDPKGQLAMYLSVVHRSYVTDFKKYKKDYEAVLEEALKYRDKYINEEYSFLYVNTYNTKVACFLSPDDEVYHVSKEVAQSLVNVGKSFDDPDNPLDKIKFYENTVIFFAGRDTFGIVYTLDGKKPTTLNVYDDLDYKYYVKKLAKNWYSVTGTLKSDLY